MKKTFKKNLILAPMIGASLSMVLLIGQSLFCQINSISQFKPLIIDIPVIELIEEFTEEFTKSIEDFPKQLGQNFIVGISGRALDEETKKILRYIRPAGIILYYKNYNSLSQFEELIEELQEISFADTNFPFFIMLDEEPGGATRLNLFKNVLPSAAPDWETIKDDVKVLRKAGINVELAPLCDFPFNDDSFIKRRIPAENVEDLIEFNQTFINLLCRYEILATLKHFPGMGIFADDPHKKIPRSDISQEVLDESLRIFQNGIDSGADFVMTGHAVYENIDPDNSATLSSEIVTGLLKERLDFQGLVITDDLSSMPFITNEEMTLADASVQAIKAGHHLIVFSHELKKTEKIFDEILVKAQDDSELKSIIKDNYLKIVDFKKERLTEN